jgi:hypothetical protein
MDYTKIQPYKRRVRPNNPESLSPFLDSELLRVATASQDALAALKDLDARLRAAGL